MAHKQKSFTLIEMLIVVVIIGILAAALIPRLQSVQARARDTKRKADLHQIGTALEIYKQDNGSLTKIVYEKTLGQVWQIGDGTYMVIPYTTAQQFYQ
ncbi:MAG: prepilin-type N-terminal cleavage/methylation domain-containing protein [bacterium]